MIPDRYLEVDTEPTMLALVGSAAIVMFWMSNLVDRDHWLRKALRFLAFLTIACALFLS